MAETTTWRQNWHKDAALRGNLLHLAWPVISEQLLISLVAMIATAMIGRISTVALSAVGVVNMTVTVIQSLMAILSMGATVVIARLTGAGEHRQAQNAARQSLLGAFVIAIVLPLILWVFARQIFSVFLSRAEEAVVENALLYFRMQLPGIPFFIVNLVASGILRGAGEMRKPMYIALLVNVISVMISYPLMFGIGGFQGIGIQGTGIAMSIARTIGGLVILSILLGGRAGIYVPCVGLFRMDWKMLHRVLHVGIPASMEQVALMGGNLMVQIVIAFMPTSDMAANQVLVSLASIPRSIILGLGMATTTLAGQYLGAGRTDLAARGTVQAVALGGITNILSYFICVFIHPLASIYSNDPAVLATVYQVVLYYVIAETFLSPLNVLPAALRAGGDIMFVSYSNILGVSILRVGGTYILSQYFGLGIEALYFTMGVDYALRTLAYILRFRGGRWKHIKV